jgi:hypothetical protein
MKRTYLEEDLELIQKYFPGAKTVTLRTPFDLTRRTGCLPRLAAADKDTGNRSWARDILWTN